MDLQCKAPRILLNWILILLFCVTIPIQALESRKLAEEKCAPCGDTPTAPPPPIVYPSPPPPIVYPSPPPPSPSPPPVVDYSPPPPPSPKKPPSVYCPPPPSSTSDQYITGPPGNLYPVVENFNGGATLDVRRSFPVFLPLLLVLLSLLVF